MWRLILCFVFLFRKYTRGTKVKVHIHSMEMSSKFLGAEEHVTLLEADGALLGLYDSDMETKDTSIAQDG